MRLMATDGNDMCSPAKEQDAEHDCGINGGHHVPPPPSRTISSSTDSTTLNDLSPPQSVGEKWRDAILRGLDSKCFQILGFIVLFLVVLDGAIFFFFLMGWQTTCRPRTDCEPRNQIYNISVHILNGLFTYMAIVSMPWRCSNALHVFGLGIPPRAHGLGQDLYGRPNAQDVWFHIPLFHRRIIIVTLLLNCIFQFINQGTRGFFWNYGLQDKYPGNLWTNIFFGLSMLCAAVGALHLVIVEHRIRQRHSELFEPGPIQQLTAWWRGRRQKRKESLPAERDLEDNMVTEVAGETARRHIIKDPTQNRSGSVLGFSGDSVRGGLRLFAL